MTYYERFGQTGTTEEGRVPAHPHEAGDISGSWALIRLGVGGRLQTATSGQRIVLTAVEPGLISLYSGDSDELYVAAIEIHPAGFDPSSWLEMKGPATAAYPQPASIVLSPGTDAADSSIIISGSLWTTAADALLGYPGLPWGDVYATRIFDEGSNMRLDLSELSYGAPDSGGVGYKVIRQPN